MIIVNNVSSLTLYIMFHVSFFYIYFQLLLTNYYNVFAEPL
jgi:hypothetical protein